MQPLAHFTQPAWEMQAEACKEYTDVTDEIQRRCTMCSMYQTMQCASTLHSSRAWLLVDRVFAQI
eukprot:1967526-Amphidinium_carterae.2